MGGWVEARHVLPQNPNRKAADAQSASVRHPAPLQQHSTAAAQPAAPMPGASASGRFPKWPIKKVEMREEEAVAVMRLRVRSVMHLVAAGSPELTRH